MDGNTSSIPETQSESRAVFERRVREQAAKWGWQQLPPLDVAMYPPTVSFADDLSGTRYFNERFIESRVTEGMSVTTLGMIGFWHNLLLGSTILVCVYERAINWLLVIAYLMLGVGIFLGGTYLVVKGTGGLFVRFNRQAQLVHFMGGDKYADQMLHLPWRDVVAFTEFGRAVTGSYFLQLLFPTPPGVDDRGHVLQTSGALDATDWTFLNQNLMRWEFLRRYMESGLEAVRPDPKLLRAGMVDKPSGHVNEETSGPVSAFFQFLWKLLFYYGGGGPLIHRWIKRRADNFRWPQEVERLCAEGADLSGYDTTPVTPQTNLYYRFAGIAQGIEYVDAQGNVIG